MTALLTLESMQRTGNNTPSSFRRESKKEIIATFSAWVSLPVDAVTLHLPLQRPLLVGLACMHAILHISVMQSVHAICAVQVHSTAPVSCSNDILQLIINQTYAFLDADFDAKRAGNAISAYMALPGCAKAAIMTSTAAGASSGQGITAKQVPPPWLKKATPFHCQAGLCAHPILSAWPCLWFT